MKPIFTKAMLLYALCGLLSPVAMGRTTVAEGQREFKSSRAERQMEERKSGVRELRSSSRPERVMNRAAAQKPCPVKKSVSSQDETALYAWSQYPSTAEDRKGLYRLNGKEGITLEWEDPYYYDIEGMTLRNGYYKDGKIIGLAVDEAMGVIFDMARVEYDFKTGKVEDSFFINDNIYLDRLAYDPVNNVVYATSNEYGEEVRWLKIDESDWNNYEEITTLETGVGSICYNAVEGACFGIDHNKNFVRIETDGFTSIISHIDFDFQAGLIGGIVYSPKEDLYYANVGTDSSSFLMTITPLGDWDVYYELPGNNQLCFMFTPDAVMEVDPARPAKPELVSFDFAAGATSGSLSCLIPSVMMDNSPVPGELEVVAMLDGQEYKRLTASPGETVKIDFSDLEPATHYFGIYSVYDNHSSQTLMLTKYVGPDVPLAPANVKLDAGSVSWEPVTAGVHDGYLDLNALKYVVTINGVEYGQTKETTLAIELPDEEMQVYKASVYAEADGIRSAAGVSKGFVHGNPLSLPMEILPTPEQAQMVIIIDGNEDGYYWYYDSKYESFGCDYSDYGVENDDWLIMPPFRVEDGVGRCKLSFLVGNYNEYYPMERLEVYLGQEDKDGAIVMDKEIVAPFTPTVFVMDGHQSVEAEFDIPLSGVYYIGFHWISDPEQAGMELKDILVEAVPGSVVRGISGADGIILPLKDGVKVYGNPGDRIGIFATDGKTIVNEKLMKEGSFYTLPSGLYIVSVNDKRIKILVK